MIALATKSAMFPDDRPAPSREVRRVTCQTGYPEYFTPPAIIGSARRVMGGIDLDPASCDAAQQIVKATKYHTIADSGLLHPWSGRVWLNPPYSMPEIQQFVGRLVASYAAGDVTQAVLLTDAATDTRWFRAAMEAATAVCWTTGRIRFLRPEIAGKFKPSSPTRGQVLFYFGDQVQRFAVEFSRWGKVLILRTRSTTTCRHCGREFSPTRSDALYCSAACRQASYRGRAALRLAVTATGPQEAQL